VQFVSESDARTTLAHVYDTLWLTHLSREQRLNELRGWSDVLRDARERELFADRFRGYVPQPPTGTSPGTALAAVVADDASIETLNQPVVTVPVAATSGRREFPSWWPGVVAIVALLLIGGLAFLTLGDDDDDDIQAVVPTIPIDPSATSNDSAAVASFTTTTLPAETTETTETAEPIEPTPASTTAAEASVTEDGSPTASSVAETATTSQPTPTSADITATNTSQAIATVTPRATATERATATPTTPPPTATPSIIYEANWS